MASVLDAGSPRWTPRNPSVEEEMLLGRLRYLWQCAANQLGARQKVEAKDVEELSWSVGRHYWVDDLGSLRVSVYSID